MTALRPADAEEARRAIEWAVGDNQTLEIVAGGSKRRLGRPAPTDHVLALDRIAGIVDYEPSELVLTARAATPIAEIEALLDASHQTLAFEPPDWSGLLGRCFPTLGGVIATNAAGPRRVRAGAPRDHFLGFSAINGWGEAWKAGGKVVKNVTGYDMCKLQAGAFGTLSVLTELSVRVMPKPESACTLLLSGLDDEGAVALMARALNTPHEVSAAAHNPGSGLTALRLEGPAPSVAFRADALAHLLGPIAERLDATDTDRFWSGIGAVRPLPKPGLETGDRCLWRLCPTPSEAPQIVRRIRASLPSADALYDWGGGLVWLGLETGDAGPDAGAAVVRAALRHGHATLFVAPDAIREAVAVFEPEPAPLDALSRRIKEGFDPHLILNPGRLRKER